MEEQFMRTEALIGEQGIEKLHKAHVMVVGCGAVGSFAIETLARSGVGHLTLVDFDTVELSNINRQLVALHSTVGKKKTEVAKARVLDIYPKADVSVIDTFLDEQNADAVLSSQPDFVIDAIDSLDSKAILIEKLLEKGIHFISSMGAARRFSTELIEVTKMKKTTVCLMASALRRKLHQRKVNMDFKCVYSSEPPRPIVAENGVMGSFVGVTGIFGLMLAQEAILTILSPKQG